MGHIYPTGTGKFCVLSLHISVVTKDKLMNIATKEQIPVNLQILFKKIVLHLHL